MDGLTHTKQLLNLFCIVYIPSMNVSYKCLSRYGHPGNFDAENPHFEDVLDFDL